MVRIDLEQSGRTEQLRESRLLHSASHDEHRKHGASLEGRSGEFRGVLLAVTGFDSKAFVILPSVSRLSSYASSHFKASRTE